MRNSRQRRRRSNLGKRLFAGLRNRPERRNSGARKSISERDPKIEPLEPRQLLAVGPQLVALQPNLGDTLFLSDLREPTPDRLDAAPQQLKFIFNEGTVIDESTIDTGIRIVRAGFDGQFGQANDRLVFPGHPLKNDAPFPGFFGVNPDEPNEIIIRFPEALPDDLYRVTIFGQTGTPGALADINGDTFGIDDLNRNLSFDLNLELPATIISVVPEPIERNGDGSLSQAKDTILVYFNEDDDNFIETVGGAQGAANDPGFYQLIFTNDTVTNADNEKFFPTVVDYNTDTDMVTLQFADDLDKLTSGSGTYRLRIGTDEATPADPVPHQLRTAIATDMNTDGATEITFQANTHVGSGDPIIIDFVAEDRGTASPVPGLLVDGRTITVTLNSNPAALTMSQHVVDAFQDPDIVQATRALVLVERSAGLPLVDVTTPNLAGLTLRIIDPGSAFSTAFDVNAELGIDLSQEPVVISSEIESQWYGLTFPGSDFDLGHRPLTLPGGSHVIRRTDQDPGVIAIPYNFRPVIGTRTDGSPAFNLITEVQKLRVREAFTIWGNFLGVQFFETIERGFTIATSELENISPVTPSGVGDQDGAGDWSLSGLIIDPVLGPVPTAIMDAAEPWDDVFGASDNPNETPSYFIEAMKQIGVLLGLAELPQIPELPPLQVMQEYPPLEAAPGAPANTPEYSLTAQPPETDIFFGTPGVQTVVEPVFPGDHDIVHGQYLHRPEGRDIDLFSFGLSEPGLLTLETFAERLPNASLLDSVLTLYRKEAQTESYEIYSRNDDYFSEDSFIELFVDEGEYMVAVSSTGNTDFDPTIEDTGFGGTTEGKYDLRISFRPQVKPENIIMETTGVAFDGDADGVPQGVYEFWSRTEGDIRSLFLRGGGEMFEDGQQFTIKGNTGLSLTFEFDNDADTNSAHPITFVGNEDLPTMANLIADAIQDRFAILGVTTTVNGERIELSGEDEVLIDPEFGAMGLHGKMIYVDKVAPNGGDGSLSAPIRNIDDAIAASRFGDIIRIVGNGGRLFEELDQFGNPVLGEDGNPLPYSLNNTSIDAVLSPEDNLAYEIGFDVSQAIPRPLQDGTTMDIPAGVTVMIDSGAMFKLRDASITVGTNSATVKRNAGALQVFGRPRVLNNNGAVIRDADGQPVAGSVLFTSYDDQKNGEDTNPLIPKLFPDAGDWGGLVFRNDLDKADGLFNYDDQGIFLNYVNHADIRYGGGFVEVDSVPRINNPIHMRDARPTITYNTITKSADAAMSANPDSFREDTFNAPEFQQDGLFTSDYRRVGPEIHGNRLLTYRDDDNAPGLERHANTFNSLFIRTLTPAGQDIEELTVSARWDDTDIVHTVAENLFIAGTPGGPTGKPNLVFNAVPEEEPGIEQIIPEVDFVDYAAAEESNFTLTGRLDASLNIDPRIVVKLSGARIEAGLGAQLIAEGLPGQEVIFTSGGDDRYGAGGIFDTSNDRQTRVAKPGDWGGIVFMHLANGSIDQALVAFGGGSTRIEGEFASFNAVEVHQSEVRIANTLFEENANGHGTNEYSSRLGRGFNDPATIYIRGAQPIIVGNTFQNNGLFLNDPQLDQATIDDPTPVISVNVNALNSRYVKERGRSTGVIDLMRDANGALVGEDNQGPLIAENRLSLYEANSFSPFTDLPQNRDQLNGMLVRPHTLTTEVVWDDTSIAHVVMDEIYVPNFHTYGGLRIESNAKGSLVVKLGQDTHIDPVTEQVTTTIGAITVGGEPFDIADRIGGRLQVIGHGGFPVVFTSIADDTVTAGLDPKLRPVGDTNSDGDATQAEPGDWRSIRIDEYAHDRNVAVYTEQESPVEKPPTMQAPTGNSIPSQAEYLGLLAPHEKGGDDNQRLGFEVLGIINHPSDVDTYSFEATAGTEVWIDLDRTSHDLDAIVEMISSNGIILARSDNSVAEDIGYEDVFESIVLTANPMRESAFEIPDHYGMNAFDPGMRVVLPGAPNSINTYHVRVRSSNRELLADTPDLDANIFGGLTSGTYQMQIRLGETHEVAGTFVQFADIRYAENGIEVYGQPTHSPLTGEAIEDRTINNTFGDAQNIGNLFRSDRQAISVNGTLDVEEDPNNPGQFFTPEDWHDIDWYRVTMSGSVIIEMDYAAGIGRPDTMLWLFDIEGRLVARSNNSLIQEDVPAPLNGADLTDLSRGTVSASDPFIGPIDLPADVNGDGIPDDYFIAVTPIFRSATEVGNVGTIVEPVDSIGRIVEDHLEFPDYALTPAAYYPSPIPPVVPPLSPIYNIPYPQAVSTWEYPQMGFWDEVKAEPHPFIDTISPVEYHLGDVVLFASTMAITAGNFSGVYTINPFTGTTETYLGDFPHRIDDISLLNRDLHGFTVFDDNPPDPQPPGIAQSDAVSGNLIRISASDASSVNVGDDGIATYEEVPAGSGTAVQPNNGAGDGIQFHALELLPGNPPRWLSVGNRGLAFDPATDEPALNIDFDTNILYAHDAASGTAISGRPGNRPVGNEGLFEGAGTNIRERGELLTSPKISLIDQFDRDGDGSRNDPLDATMLRYNNNGQLIDTIFSLVDGTTLTVLVDDQVTTFEFDTGPDIEQQLDIGNDISIRDGQFFFLDPNELFANDEVLYQLDTGAVIQFTLTGGGINDGQTISVDAAAQNAPTLTFEFDKDGKLVGQGNVAVPIANNMGAVGVAGALAAAINGSNWAPGTVTASAAGQRVTVSGDFAINIGPGSNGVILEGDGGEAPILQLVDGSQILDEGTFELQTRSNQGNPTTFEFDSGWTLQVPGNGGQGVADGEWFLVDDGQGNVVAFEFEDVTPPGPADGVPENAYPPGTVVIPINFTTDDTQDELTVNIVNQIQTSPLNLTFDNGIGVSPAQPQAYENGVVWLGGDAGVNVTEASGLSITGRFGVTDPTHARVPYLPTRGFSEADVGLNINDAITNAAVTYSPLVVTAADRFEPRTYTINDGGTVLTFIMDDTRNGPLGVLPANTFAVPFDGGDANADPPIPPEDVDTIANTFAGVITTNASTIQATAPGFGGLIALAPVTGSLQAFSDLYGDKLVVNGDGITFAPGSSPIDKLIIYEQIPVEEVTINAAGNDISAQAIGAAVASVVDGHPLFDAGAAGERISFLGAHSGDFGAIDVWNPDEDADGSPAFGGVAPSHVAIGIVADDTAAIVAQKIADAINGAMRPAVTARASTESVRLNRGVTSIDEPGGASGFDTFGSGPGGNITGIALAGGLYAVSDEGGLYRINNYLGSYTGPNTGATATYVATSAADLEGIRFTSLEAGPPSVEGGRYANMLFAFGVVEDDFGFEETRLFAFDTAGVLQPIFVNGQTSLPITIPGALTGMVDGLVFSDLDYNLWHWAPEIGDPDYVIEIPPTQSRNMFQGGTTAEFGGASWHFGEVSPTHYAYNTYNHAGGAYGELVSNEFSLVGYSPDDQPRLYFSYYSDVADVEEVPNSGILLDSFLVYATANDGNWSLLGELDDTGGQYSQASFSLAGFAGEDNVRVKFVFSSAGYIRVGDPFVIGEEIRAISGAELIDGQTMEILHTPSSGIPEILVFEVDLGHTLVLPSGGRIQEGETISVEGDAGDITTYEFDTDGDVGDSFAVPDSLQVNIPDGATVDLVQGGTVTQTVELDTGILLERSIFAPTNRAVNDGDYLRVVTTDGEEWYFEFEGDFVDNDLLGINPGIGVGDRFTIDNQVDPAVTFEFYTAAPPAAPLVGVLLGGSPSTNAFNMVNAINNSPIGGSVTARRIGPNLDIIQLSGIDVTFNTTSFAIDPITSAFGTPVNGALVFHDFIDFAPGDANNNGSTTPVELAEFIADAFEVTIPTIDVGLLAEPDDTMDLATESGLGQSGFTRFTLDGTIGDGVHADPVLDVDLIEVPMTAGDSIEISIADAIGVDTYVRVLDVDGSEWAAGPTQPFGPDLTFDAPSTGIYYVGISSLENTDYDAAVAESGTYVNPSTGGYSMLIDFTSGQSRSLGGGTVQFGNAVATVDTTGMPFYTTTGTIGVTPGNIALPYAPTADRTGHQLGPQIADLLNAHAGAGTIVSQGRLLLPTDPVNDTLAGTLNLTPINNIPVEYSYRWTASEVAERLRQVMDPPNLTFPFLPVTLPTGVDVVMMPLEELEGNNGSTHPENHITTEFEGDIRPGGTIVEESRNLTNQLNLPGATFVSQSPAPGQAVAQVQIRGQAGVLEGNIPIRTYVDLFGNNVPIDVSSHRDDVAAALDFSLETQLADDQILIVENGSFYQDGNWFKLTDLNVTTIYEFETGYVFNVPDAGGSTANGGVADSDTFEISDGIDNFVFEFDSDRIINDVLVVTDAGAVLDGHTFTLGDDVNPPFVFEFQDVTVNPAIGANRIPVFFNQGVDDPHTIALAMETAIDGANISRNVLNPDGTTTTLTLDAETSPLTAVGRHGNRVHLKGLQLDPKKDGGGVLENSAGLEVVDIERLYLNDLIVIDALEKIYDGDYITITEPATYQNPRTVIFEFRDLSQGLTLNNPGAFAVDYDSRFDDATDIAQALANEIGLAAAQGLLRGVTAQTVGVNNTSVEVMQAQPTFNVNGVPELTVTPEGLINVGDPSNIVDEQTFTVSEPPGTPNRRTVTFEFRNINLGPGMANTNNTPVNYLPTDSPTAILRAMATAINNSNLRGLNASVEGPASLAIELTAAVDINASEAPGVRLTNVVAGRNVQGLTVEMIIIDGSSTGLAVAQAIASTMRQAELTSLNFGLTVSLDQAPFGIDPLVLSEINNSRVQLGGFTGTELTIFSNTLTVTGEPGIDPTHIGLDIIPAEFFTAEDVAVELANAINAFGNPLDMLATQGEPPRRILLTPLLDDTNVVTLDNNGLAIRLEAATDVVKHEEDLVRIIMDTVIDPGPFGWDPDFEVPADEDIGHYSALRGTNNDHFGVFIDDIIIGFAERGEMVTGADSNTAFTPPPDPRPLFNNGGYQFEIRTAADYIDRAAPTGVPLYRTFDTNDRFDDTVVVELPTGAEVVDQQEFVLGDGLNDVTFTYRDVTPAALQAGHDSANEALDTGITAGDEDFKRFYGVIGDNFEMFVPEAEVDMVKLEVEVGTIFSVDVDAWSIGSPLNAVLRVFFDDGLNVQQIALNDNDTVPLAPNEQASVDPYLLIQAPFTGTYYVGVSGSPNFLYDPELEGSGVFGSTGFYELEIMVGENGGLEPTEIPFDAMDFDWEITQRVRDIINHEDIQGYVDPLTGDIFPQMLDVQASGWDGASLVQQDSTAGRLNLFGDAVRVGVIHTDLLAEGNDTLETAVVAGLIPGLPADWFGVGQIGDNPELSERHELDVDFLAVELGFNEELVVDIDSDFPDVYNPEVYLFTIDDKGTIIEDDDEVVRVQAYDPEFVPTVMFGLVNLNDDHVTTTQNEEFVETDSYIVFTYDDTQLFPWEDPNNPPAERTFYIGISAHDNQPVQFREQEGLPGGYDPEVAGSGDFISAISSGDYTVHVKVGNGAIASTVFQTIGQPDRLDDPNKNNSERTVIGQMIGDPNRFRDQGQIILHGNRIMDSENFGIIVAPGLRTGLDNSIPHSGPVRLTREINTDNLTTGVTITNNIVAFGGAGGIVYSGDPNTSLGGDGPVGAVPHGRIINNTLFGIGGSDYTGTQEWIVVADAGADIGEGDFFVITDAAGNQVDFEFTTDANILGDVPVNFDPADPDTTVALSMATAINAAAANGQLVGVAATVNGNQVTITGVADITGVGAQMIRLAVDAGVFILNNASPTVMNNIIANYDFGIAIDASSDVVLGGTLYADNLTNAGDPFGQPIPLGEFAINLDNETNQTLFVDPGNKNFYLDSGSLAIDSAIDSIEERFELNTVKAPLGIPPSPMLAPNTDQAGLRREDDPNVDTPGGVGDNLFKDRGALDRVDFTGPVASLVAPEDNDANGIDRNGLEGYVDIVGEPVDQFVIQLQDKTDAVDGIGIDDNTVNPGVITITHNGQPLQEGIDYRFEYDATNDSILINPQAGIFEPGEYIIELANDAQLFIDAPAAASIVDDGVTATTFTITDPFGNQLTFEFEDTTQNNGLLDPASGNFLIPYNPGMSPAQIAQAIATAINAASADSLLSGITPNLQAASVGVGDPEDVNVSPVGFTHTEGGITDLANNPLKPNTNDNETLFVINITSERDFGDAPDNTDEPIFPVSYNTVEENAGAFHYFFEGFRLGANFDFEIDGQPSADASGDGIDEDGVSFPNGFYATYTSRVVVDVNKPPEIVQDAYVDGWIDYNQNGIWEEVDEHIIHEVVVNGTNEFFVTVPATVPIGDTFARFRLSIEDDMGPTGEGGLGEVEDYQVRVGPQFPWHNFNNPGDVNDSGNITTLDLIILHSFLYQNGPAPLTPPGLPGWPAPLPGDPAGSPPFPISGPAPYLDVNMDNYVGLEDARDLQLMALDRPVGPPPAPQGDGGSGPARQNLPPEDPADTPVIEQPTIEVGSGVAEEVPPADTGSVIAVGMIVDSPANSVFSADDGSATLVDDGPRTDLAGPPAETVPVGFSSLTSIVDNLLAERAEQAANHVYNGLPDLHIERTVVDETILAAVAERESERARVADAIADIVDDDVNLSDVDLGKLLNEMFDA